MLKFEYRSLPCVFISLVSVLMLLSVGCTKENQADLMLNPEPLPEFIQFVEPDAGEIITVGGFSQWNHYDPPGSPPQLALPGICVRLNFPPLIEPGDNFFEEDVMSERTHVSVNGTQLSMMDEFLRFPSVYVLYDEQGIPIAESPTGELYCWEFSPVVGIVTAKVTVVHSSGKESTYSWAFELIGDK